MDSMSPPPRMDGDRARVDPGATAVVATAKASNRRANPYAGGMDGLEVTGAGEEAPQDGDCGKDNARRRFRKPSA
jgi:hypothetical protein